MSFRGGAKARNPESRPKSRPKLWIPGSRLTARPGMTAKLKLRGLVFVVPPRQRDAAEVFRLPLRAAEHVPVRDAVGVEIPVRHPIAPGPDHAIERVAGGREFLAGPGCDDDVDQCVDHGI